MNFSMQITHSNQKWIPPCSLLKRQEHQLCFVDRVLSSLVLSALWSAVTERDSCPDKTNQRSHIFGIHYDISVLRFQAIIQPTSWVATVRKNTETKAWSNHSVLFFFFCVCLRIELHIHSQGTGFSVLNICTCFTSVYFSLSCSSLTTGTLLFPLPLRLDRPVESAYGERRDDVVLLYWKLKWCIFAYDTVQVSPHILKLQTCPNHFSDLLYISQNVLFHSWKFSYAACYVDVNE